MLIDNLLHTIEQMGPVGGIMNLAEGLGMAVRFQVHNVARYVREQLVDEHNSMEMSRFPPNVAPLAPVMWFEYDGASVGKSPSNRYGIFITVIYDDSLQMR